jgi:hypothetical protein
MAATGVRTSWGSTQTSQYCGPPGRKEVFPMNCLPTAGPRDHTVRFYRAEEELAATVGSYLADRSRAGLDHERFRSVVSELIRRAAASGRRVRSYGEMVASRWNRGHADVIATRSFPAELDSVRAARHVTAGLLDGETAQEVAELVAIVVTELASNAVLHASSGFTLTISRSPVAVRIAVRDDSPLVPLDDGRPFDIRTGHGLSVVTQLACAWDVEGLPNGKVVWAELAAG